MNVEQKLRELEQIQRPFSHPFPATVDDVYLIDNTFAFGVVELYRGGYTVLFAADRQLQILREHAKRDKELHGIGIGQLALTFNLGQRAVYLDGRVSDRVPRF